MYLRDKQDVDQATGEEDLNPLRSSAAFSQDVGGELSGARKILVCGKLMKVWSSEKLDIKQMQAEGLMCNSDLPTGFPPKDNEGSGMCAKCKK